MEKSTIQKLCSIFKSAQTREDKTESGLLPCPFCGGKAEIKTGMSENMIYTPTCMVQCVKCGIKGKNFDDENRDGNNIVLAAEAWNKRDVQGNEDDLRNECE